MKLKGNIDKLQYKTLQSAGFDLVSTENVVLPAGEWYAVGTGVFIEEAGEFEDLEIRPRSGLAYNHGVTVLNSPGTIDADYPGEIKVILYNGSKELYAVMTGDRIAQAVLRKHKRVENVPVAETKREGGLGSTGKN